MEPQKSFVSAINRSRFYPCESSSKLNEFCKICQELRRAADVGRSVVNSKGQGKALDINTGIVGLTRHTMIGAAGKMAI